ncbi:hypothetical protein OH807_01165 [Kitasatospora sp. NBC_01560]|uniref:hypothetical protein n=1 Tax=Kitasatospora sp. NBC_01560 TaxID=2975965 RepID=UPI003863CC1B
MLDGPVGEDRGHHYGRPVRLGKIVVHRNLIGDSGIDHLLAQPDWPRAEKLAGHDGDWNGPGLSWRDIAHIAETPDLAAPGVHDTAAPTPPAAPPHQRAVAQLLGVTGQPE